MTTQIEDIKKTRIHILNLVTELTVEQLNEIPTGFNNNIIWNLGHLVASQQSISYLRAGLPPFIDEKYFLAYKPGTSPGQFVDSEQVEAIKKIFLTAIDRFGIDYHNNLFTSYPSWTSHYGIGNNNIDDAVNFTLFHEGLHLGYIMALKRLVKK
jgi:hypothetical protein